MRLSTSSWWGSFATVALNLLLLAEHVHSQCITNLSFIFVRETSLASLAARTYNLCTDTVFNPGRLTVNGLQGGSFPLFVRSNSVVSCGASGSRGGNCVIDGEFAENALVFYPPAFLASSELVLENIELRGITFTNFKGPEQIAVFIAGTTGSVTFTDCVFIDNSADPAFFQVIQIPSRRRLELDETDADAEEVEQKRLIASLDEDPEKKIQVAFKLLEKLNIKIRNLLQKGADEPEGASTESEGDVRQLGITADPTRLVIRVQESLFQNNFLPQDTEQPGQRTIFFMGRSNSALQTVVRVASTLDLALVRNDFVNNNFDIAGDQSPYRTFIDFYSNGLCFIENNCWIDSPVSPSDMSALGLIRSGTGFQFENNYVTPDQGLTCPGLLILESFEYTVRSCAEVTFATECLSDAAPTSPATPSPTTPSPTTPSPTTPSPTTPSPTMPTPTTPNPTPIPTTPSPTITASVAPTDAPSGSFQPSGSFLPSGEPSQLPSASHLPSGQPSMSPKPSASSRPSSQPSVSLQPSVSSMPSSVQEFECFSGETLVDVQGKGTIAMKELQLGDYVKTTASEEYHRVYSFGHLHHKVLVEYLQFLPSRLEVTSNHMVYLKGSSRPVPASQIQVGDVLENQDEPVSKIRAVRRHGAYAPFAASGFLLVNGVKVSSYVAFQDSPTLKVAWLETNISYQWIAHAFQVPHLLYCTYMPGTPCDVEEYDDQGLLSSMSVPLEASKWLTEDRNSWILAFAVIPILAVFCFLVFLEKLLLEEDPMVIATVLGFLAIVAMKKMAVFRADKKTLRG